MAALNPIRIEPYDYTNWTQADLVRRVETLETQLRAKNAQYTRLAKSQSPQRLSCPPTKPPKKSPKPFDPSKYSTRHIALKFAYLGARYNGFEHHANNNTPLTTVEEELWRALRKTKLILPVFREGQSEDEVCWDGCEYSKCGRTDRGVSAFGQVVALRVRSSRPKERERNAALETGSDVDHEDASGENVDEAHARAWHDTRDELPYIQLLNRVLPPDIRILAWCPNPLDNFSARFNCKERRYRYFFTNPAYMPHPQIAQSSAGNGWLDVEKMHKAAEKFIGLHDFRNFCKVDPSKQITNFERRVFSAGIHQLPLEEQAGAFLFKPPFDDCTNNGKGADAVSEPQVFYFEVRGSAFLWHQVRHLVAVLFLVGQGLEDPSIVDHLLDVQNTPAKPLYEMASDIPLVLWDCIFPDAQSANNNNAHSAERVNHAGFEDALDWVYVGDQERDQAGGKGSVLSNAMQDRKYGRLGIMEDLWAIWRKRKMDELLAGSLMNLIVQQGDLPKRESEAALLASADRSARVFDGSELPRTVGTYIPIKRRECAETPAVLNARYALRKGLNGSAQINGDADIGD